ncbi:L-type lectin-domain containing receptor kinase IX.1-like isoform X1 [Rhododendron vialii]|uniref:L-type lectin-domain containing receptor kinase IX.1-like isoform X1 n=1 Tax=Rhododendron vialii TaxID=182163 RepID=UPI00265FBBE7|nr:L-type lectin-domain containing receptor kinase IX.1-like isoform X1 [Rhododendron vialii]
MAIFNFQMLLYSLSMFFFCILFPKTSSLTFKVTNFYDPVQSANITINQSGSAAYFSSGGLQVTSNDRSVNQTDQVGKATYIHQLDLWDETTGKLTDFNTHFVFAIDSNGKENFGDGLTFFLVPDASQMSTHGGAMGLPIDPVTMKNTSTFVAVEFDTYWNGPNAWNGPIVWEPKDISPVTHVGINVNSLNSTNFSVWHCDIPQGIENEAWITYDSSSFNLSVVVTGSINNSRVYDTIHSIINLRDYLPNRVTIGFSASTGWAFETHTIKSWDFNSSLVISETNTTVTVNTENRNVTDPGIIPGSKKISLGAVVGSVVGSGVLVGAFVLVGFGFWRRRRAKEEDEFEVEMSMENEFESGSGPKKFSYGQLSRATNNFEEGQKLGEGGFDGVYRGFLRESNSYIAVKRISKGSKQGIKEYATEVKIISRLRHRNLVQPIGWYHEKKELLLVYEFMENGSLDFHLFQGKSLLTWGTRYKIAQGLASALLYLHEEWEQCVVHRDVKSSNVMLDSNFNAKLGDFGLARFVDHEKQPETTLLAGTMGYLASECVVTGKASKESDVYSFGVVALEIACGRKPLDSKVPESQMRLVEWVSDLYGMGRLFEAVDAKLGSDFDEQETEHLMIVGLWCAHPDHNFWPKIRQAIHVLNFEAPMPTLPPKLPVLSFFPLPLSTTTNSSNISQNQYSSYTYNTDSSKFTSSSSASSPSISLLNKE